MKMENKKKSSYTVYLLEHKQHGKYVGVTSRNLNVRFQELMRDTRKHGSCKVRAAIKRSGGRGWKISAVESFKAASLADARKVERRVKRDVRPNLNEPSPKPGGAGGRFLPGRCHK